MKRIFSLVLAFLLMLAWAPTKAESVEISGRVSEIEKYGHVRLDITIEDFNRAGFDLGDIVTVTAGNFSGDMPYLNGYYVDRGEPMLRAYPGHTYIGVCINYGRFADTAGVEVGDPVTITLREKAGALALQEISNLEYSNDRADAVSDEVFANFRPVKEGRLYRSASPVENRYGRAAFADALIWEAGVRTVMDMANTDEEIESFFTEEDYASPYFQELYRSGQVIALGLPVNFDSDEFGEGVVKGFTFLADREPPYLVHCVEGKDRSGFAAMILEMLMGWDERDIAADYMVSYTNYYGIEPGTEKYVMIEDKNVKEMMRFVAGVTGDSSMEEIDWKSAAETYLKDHGMTESALEALERKLQ